MDAIPVIWLFDVATAFERDWLLELFGDVPVENTYLKWDEDGRPPHVISNALIVFNHSVDYEEYLALYDQSRAPYGAIHLSDETLNDSCSYLNSEMCLFAFRNYHHPIISKHPKVTTLGLGYKSGFGDNVPCGGNDSQQWYHWCFAGNIHDKRRQNAIQTFRSFFVPFKLHVTHGGFNAAGGLDTAMYRKMLEESKFALCPIGQGNLDSFRLYEALEAGSIPIALGNQDVQAYDKWGIARTYWHALFEAEEVPFIVANTWEDCAKLMLKLLMDRHLFENVRDQTKQFWAGVKKKWSSCMQSRLRVLLKNPCDPQ